MTGQDSFLLLDSNVLSDYMRVAEHILKQVSCSVGKIYVPSTVVEECCDIEFSDCERLGLSVIEPTLVQVAEASIRGGPLSFQDKICLLICREENFTCVTNDKSLRNACLRDGLTTLWGLQLLLKLAKIGEISTSEAKQIAQKIHESNPGFITQAILANFVEKASAIEAE